MNKLLIFSIPLLLFMFKTSAYSQEAQSIEVKYMVNGKVKKIKNNSKVLFIQNGDTIESKICCSKVQLPGIDSNSVVDILFLFGKKELFFASISPKKLLIDQEVVWKLGYYKRFSDETKEEFYVVDDFSKVKELYYWEFEHLEGLLVMAVKESILVKQELWLIG